MSQDTTNTKKEMPKGMRYGESAFDIAYLLFDLVAAIVFFVRADGRTVFILYGFLTLCLGGGDAFHLIPRVQMHLSGPDENTTKKLGFGTAVTSVTMTVFYILLFDAMLQMPTAGAGAPAWAGTVRMVLVVLAVVRVALCLLPQNRWFDGVGDRRWGILRNVPFVAMGLVTVWYLVAWYDAWLLAALVVTSFACYMGVVLLAREKPMMGMLMIPKTVCYIWMIALFLAAV